MWCRTTMLPLSIFLMFAVSPAYAEVYQWVDEAGNVHFGDRLPEQYEQDGKPVELSVHTPTDEERRQAEALAESARRAAVDLSEQRLENNDPEESEKSTPQNQVSALPENVKPGQARLTREQRMANYEAEMARYRESVNCFAKYQKLGGGTRGYAFEECTSVRRPQHPDVR